MRQVINTIGRAAFRRSYHSIAYTEEVEPGVVRAFDDMVTRIIKPHQACRHSLFPYMSQTANNGHLTPEGFARFRHGMFSRVFTTVPSIFELGRQSFLNGDYKTAATAILNIKEEGGEGRIAFMHPLLMEECFNVIGKNVFGLNAVSMRSCYHSPYLSEEIIYRHTIDALYKEHGPIVSYMQEFASGGDNTEQHLGMMGDMYKLFHSYMNNIPRSEFMQSVRPYFAFHISLDSQTHKQVINGTAIELEHANRAKKDCLRQFKKIQDIKKLLPYMLAFLDVQERLFDAIQQDVSEGIQSDIKKGIKGIYPISVIQKLSVDNKQSPPVNAKIKHLSTPEIRR